MSQLVGIKRNLWMTQAPGGFKRMNFPINGLVLYLPLWHPELNGSTIVSKDLNAHSCTVTGATWGTLGRTFNGSSHFIDCGKAASLDITGDITILCWVNRNDVEAGMFPVCKAGGSTTYQYALYIATGRTLFFAYGNNQWLTASTILVTASAWQMIGISLTAASGFYFINATTEVSGGATPVSQDKKLSIGRRGETDDLYFGGLIGEVLIYNRALTPYEIKSIYLATKWRYQ